MVISLKHNTRYTIHNTPLYDISLYRINVYRKIEFKNIII